MEMSQAFDGFDAGCDGDWEKVFELAAADPLDAGFEVFVNGVCELILVLDS